MERASKKNKYCRALLTFLLFSLVSKTLLQNTFDYMAPADKYIPISGQFLNLFVLRAFRFINNESIFTLIVGSL